MTTYFDTATRLIRLIPDGMTDEAYLECVAEVEAPVIADVLLNTGDREFPEDLRESIGRWIAIGAVHQRSPGLMPLKDTTDRVLALRQSALLGRLHSLFHELAARRAPARWGAWSDDPRQNLVSRKAHDEPEVSR